MKRFFPYFVYLREAKGLFISGLAAGALYAAASGFGMPLMVKVVFPVIFGPKPEMEQVITHVEDAVGEEEGERLMREAFQADMENRDQTILVREWFDERYGEDRGRRYMLMAATALIPLAALLRGLTGFLNTYWIAASGLHVLLRIQQSVFEKLQRLPLGYFSGRKSGDLISRITSDAGMLQGVMTVISNDLIKQPLVLLGGVAFLVRESFYNPDAVYVLACLLTIPISVLPIRFLGKRLMRRAGNMQKEAGGNTAVLAETLGATREVRAFNLETLLANRYLDGVRRWTKLHLKVIRYRYSVPPVVEMLSAAAIAAALTMGASRGMTLTEFVPLVMALYMCYEPVKKLGEVHNRIKQGEASLDRLEEILLAEETVGDPEHPVTLDKVRGDLRFEQVRFSYGRAPALDGIDLEIPAGQVVALVGPSGAGKSTCASMIPRFYDPGEGRITLDGVDLRDLRLKDLRDHITLVPQEAVLFSGTIAENIGLGRIGASRAEIEEAAKLANAHDFITGFSAGYETPVGERGAQLSGGQKQRISIARAFLKNAPVLILDEATAALDADSEAQIQKELADLARGRTTLIIAHRFSTIRIADRILVFDGGRIVGDGTFDELKGDNPLFQSLLQNQQH